MSESTLKIGERESGPDDRSATLRSVRSLAQPPASQPARATDLTIRPAGNGQYVVKSARGADFLQLGEEEYFLLSRLDGETSASVICSSYEERFGQTLSPEDLAGFLELAREHHLLRSDDPPVEPSLAAACGQANTVCASTANTRSLLYFQKGVFDPDSLFSWMVPRIRFFWTRTFLVFSSALIVFSVVLAWTGRHELLNQIQTLFRWESLVTTWVVFLLVSVLHEFAHGLTCKRFGGEVREVGFLMMFLMPCLYCDVSSSWLFPEKSRRMWVMFAGVYFEFFLWGLAVVVWRLTLPQTFSNDLALVVLGLCGLQTLLNLIPFIKLDGYFMLSDWLEIPNLRQRALASVGGHMSWIFLGTTRPQREPCGGTLLVFGILCSVFSVGALVLVAAGVTRFAISYPGATVAAVFALGLLFLLRICRNGLAGAEVGKMAFFRSRRLWAWCLLMAVLVVAAGYVEIEDRVGGPCEIRPARQAELRAPEAGFLAEILVLEGSQVSAGQTIARLEIPDLDSRRKQKCLQVNEAAARLNLLMQGTRAEEMARQRQRIERARAWRDLAAEDLNRDEQALTAELDRLDHQSRQFQVEWRTASDSLLRLESLANSQAVTGQELEEARRRADVARSQWEQAQAQSLLRKALGTRETLAGLDARSELVSRENELADLEATLKLMDAGSRHEEIEAESAHLERLREEEKYLNQLAARLAVSCPVSGIVTTKRLHDKLGQYLQQGELICVVEDPHRLEIEIQLNEQDVAATAVGQLVELRARAFPQMKFETRVLRLAPAAARGEVQSSVPVYCEIGSPPPGLRSGMTGFARIYTGRKTLGAIAADRAVRFFRTQYWFWPW